jgi:hypothetical protein
MMIADALAPDPRLTSTLSPDDEDPDGPEIVKLEPPKLPRPGELKYRLTLLLFPSILLVFIALYVTSLASGVEPEMALLRAGVASVVLAALARVAVSILGDESRSVMNEQQIIALARSGALTDKLMAAMAKGAETDAKLTSEADDAPGVGGKE